MKDGTTSFRTDAKLRARLTALKKAKVGKNISERICLGIVCLCKQHGLEVEA